MAPKKSGVVEHTIAFLALDGMQALDFVGPLDAFYAADRIRPGYYRLITVGVHSSTVHCENGMLVKPAVSIRSAPAIDTLIIPGGAGVRAGRLDRGSMNALKSAADSCTRLVSICTGAFLLARMGLAQGRALATHWKYTDELKNEFPDIRIDENSIFINDGPVWSSAGVTAGIDLSLELISMDLGAAVATEVARELVVYLRRQGGQSQFSRPLNIQAGASSQFGNLILWIQNNLGRDLTVRDLASKAGMSERNFARRFANDFGCSPRRYIERIRMDFARHLLASKDVNIAQVANHVGYASADSFARAFHRQFSVMPSEYRARFSVSK